MSKLDNGKADSAKADNIVWGKTNVVWAGRQNSGQQNACLEPEVLAAYIDRGLSITERARVEAHLASCGQCLSLVAGVVRTAGELSEHTPSVAAPEALPVLSRRNLVGVLTAAAAVITVLVVPSMVRPWLDRDAGLVSLVETVGNERSVLGRLTGGFPHAPLGAPSAGGQDGRVVESERLVLIAGKIRESFGERQTPSRLHALGVSQLLLGQYDDAARSLLAASREQPDNAHYLSDVAAVQLERARRGMSPDDLPRALAAADRARRLDPSLREAWFNRALALSALSLNDQAKQAWTEYLNRDSASPWAGEAKRNLDRLARPTPAALWSGVESALNDGFDAAEAEAAVRAHTTEARQFIEATLLPTWAVAVASGGSGANQLARVRIFASAMQSVTGDSLYNDAVAAIDRADGAGDTARRNLALAHQEFNRAWSLINTDRISEAATPLTAVSAAFNAAGSPFAIRAATELGTIAYVRGRFTDASAAFSAALTESQARGYRFAEGRAAWMLGIVAFRQNRIPDVQASYEHMLDVFERMGDAEQVANAHNLLAGLYFYLGDTASEWQHRTVAFEGLSISRSARLKFQLLSAAASSLRRSNPETALAIQELAAVSAREAGRSSAVVDVMEQRAATLFALGRRGEAAATIADARSELGNVPDPSLRSVMEVQVLATESDLHRGGNAMQAVRNAEQALEILAQRGDHLRVAQLQMKLAKANLAAGRERQAQIALQNGIKAFDEEWSSTSDEGRISASDESWQLFETAVELALKQNDLPRAFAMAERARVRSLAEARQLPAARSLTDVQSTLQDGEAIVALNQFEDSLAIWLIKRGTANVFSRPLTGQDAAQLIARQRDEIKLGSAAPKASAALYDEILKPLGDRLRGVSRLVVVPDVAYQDAAFAGLWDQSKRRFLVEDYSVSLSPSASAYGSRPTASRSAASALIVGVGQGADAEARLVATAYASPRVLTGAEATTSALFANAGRQSIIHVSVRTIQNGDYPLLSRMILADEPGRRHSGLVLAKDIAARSLSQTGLVVLGDIDTSDSKTETQGTLSVARAFLAAGAGNVLGTLPGADETASRDLILDFHRRVSASASATEALTSIQRSVIGTNGRRLGAWCALVLYGSER